MLEAASGAWFKVSDYFSGLRDASGIAAEIL
jgi:hypothetical protein